MNFFDFFDRTYIINLARRKDRREMIRLQLESKGIALTSGKVEIFSAISPQDMMGFPSPAVRGCFLSHLAVIKKAKELNARNVLVMEDDLKFTPSFLAGQEEIINQLKKLDWGMAYFGYGLYLNQPPIQLIPLEGLINQTHFYAVNSLIFDRLISFLEAVQNRPPGHPDTGPMHLDGVYGHFRMQNPDIVTLVSNTPLGIQQSSTSDISPKFFDSIPVIKHVVAMARRCKRYLRNIQSD